MKVELIRWPEQAALRESLAGAGQPRLLILESETPPPHTSDPLEDWIRLPASEVDVAARVQALTDAGSDSPAVPLLDKENGVLRMGSDWVVVPPVEARLTAVMLERFGAVVSRDDLTRAGWGTTVTRRNSLDVHMLRLRRRVAELNLEIRTVRSRGYLMQLASPPANDDKST